MKTPQQLADAVRNAANNHRAAKLTVQRERAGLEQAKQDVEDAAEARQVIQAVAAEIQQQAHRKMAAVVTSALDAVFEGAYEFRIEFQQKRGRTEAQLQFVRDGLVLTDPKNQAGGGAVDVAAFALRLACLALARPPRRRLLVLDEPWKNVRGQENRQRMRGLVLGLAERLGLQLVVNVDLDAYPEFRAGKVIEL